MMSDILLLGGLAAVVYGFALLSPAAAWIVGGLAAMAVGTVLGVTKSTSKARRGPNTPGNA